MSKTTALIISGGGAKGAFQCGAEKYAKEAESQGITIHNPKTGKPLKYFECKIIEPDSSLGDSLDFSQTAVQASLKKGIQRARQVLGGMRPDNTTKK